MRVSLVFCTVMAASLLTPAVWAQPAPPAAPAPAPRARAMATVSTNSAYLGIGVQDIDSERAKALNLKEVRGVEVTSVTEDSPAAKAGFKEGDVVLEYNGQPVEGGEQLTRLVRETPIGRQPKVGVWRSGSMQTLTPTIEARKGMSIANGTWVMPMPEVRVPEITIPAIPQMEMPRFQMMYQNPMLGIEGEALGQESQFAEFLGVKDGVLVKAVNKNSAAEKAGIKAGDVITKVDDSKVSTTREITAALRALRSKKTVTVTVVRNKHEMPLTVTIETAGGGVGTVRARLLIQPGVFRLLVSPTLRLELSTKRGVI